MLFLPSFPAQLELAMRAVISSGAGKRVVAKILPAIIKQLQADASNQQCNLNRIVHLHAGSFLFVLKEE
jgi:hypothetical protein